MVSSSMAERVNERGGNYFPNVTYVQPSLTIGSWDTIAKIILALLTQSTII
ncbi:hypothetical protein BH18THE2_BH18THE2_19210 [soil metagenome]